MAVRGNNESGRVVFILGLLVLFVGAGSFSSGTTIATFADPAVDAGTPLFSVDFSAGTGTVNGGWDDLHTGLTLEVAYSGNTYADAFFVMNPISYNPFSGVTNSGTIKFFADGTSASGTPLIQVDFNIGHVFPTNLSAMDLFFADGVTISGSELGAVTLENESFSFGFANQFANAGGFTATSSFTSSANVVPEPTTVSLLSLGLVIIRRRKK